MAILLTAKPVICFPKNRSAKGRVHSKTCRDRIEEALVNDGDPRVERAKLRKDEYCASKATSTHQEEGGGGTERDLEPHEARDSEVENSDNNDNMDEDDVDDLMSDTVSLLMTLGINDNKSHEEANEIRKILLMSGGDKASVRAKVYEMCSPPRVTAYARKHDNLNVEGGMSFDLRADENGVKWDFNKIEHRARARRRIHQDKPFCVTDLRRALTSVH